MKEIYQFKGCEKCPAINEFCSCFSILHGGRPPCGMFAEENFNSLQQLKTDNEFTGRNVQNGTEKDILG